MIISKQIMNAANILVNNDPFSPGLIIKKGEGGIVELYASDGFILLKVTAGSFPHEDYPVLPGENFDYSEVEDFCVEIPKDSVEQIKKIQKKSHIPILNSIFISEVFDVGREEGMALSTDLSSTSKIKFKCRDGKEGFDKIAWFIEQNKDNVPSISSIHFNPYKMMDLLKCINDILGVTKQKYVAVNLTLGSEKFQPINLYAEKDGVRVEAYLMPCVK